MGQGVINYKELPEQKKVLGDKYFFIEPLTLGLKNNYKAFIVRPTDLKDESDYKIRIEGEFSYYPDGNSKRFKETKEEYEDEIVKFVFFKNELKDFPEDIQEDIKRYCHYEIE